jgi:hypothetical protein
MSTTALQNHPTVEELFSCVDTIPLALFEHVRHFPFRRWPQPDTQNTCI